MSEKSAADEAWSHAVSLIHEGQCRRAVDELVRLSESGLDVAYFVGNLYERGVGDLEKDLELAERWYERAVREGGQVDARYDLARLVLRRVEEGQGVSAERSAYADRLMASLADEGYPYALLYLGTIRLEAAALEEAENFFAHPAVRGYVLAGLQRSRIAWWKQRHFQAIGLRAKAFATLVWCLIADRNDPRLVMVYGPARSGDFENKVLK